MGAGAVAPSWLGPRFRQQIKKKPPLWRKSELLDEFVFVGGLVRFGVLGTIGDLFAEVVAFAEHFATDVDDVFRVRVVLREDDRFWNQ